MKELTLLVGVLLSLGVGFVVYRKVRDIASQGLAVALVATTSLLVAAGVVCRFLIPALVDAVRGFYGFSAVSGLGLMVGLVMFLLAVFAIGSILTQMAGLEKFEAAIWVIVVLIGFVYGRAIFWGEIQDWWRDSVLPSQEIWAFSLRLNWDIPIAAAVLILVLAGAKFFSEKF